MYNEVFCVKPESDSDSNSETTPSHIHKGKRANGLFKVNMTWPRKWKQQS